MVSGRIKPKWYEWESLPPQLADTLQDYNDEDATDSGIDAEQFSDEDGSDSDDNEEMCCDTKIFEIASLRKFQTLT